MSKTIVSFRTYPNGEVIAIFPEHAGHKGSYLCGSYMHDGQHSLCDPQGVIYETKPSTEEEKAPLRRELEEIGYDLDEKLRLTRRHYWWGSANRGK